MDVPESFRDVRERFEAGVAGGEEVGASFCVMVDGEVVVDLWGGHADRARTRPWQRDTIVNVWSATKPIAALIALLTVDETRPVAHYWPEFAANGKRDITVAQVLSHSSGLSGWREPITTEDLYDWEKCTSLLAAQEPFWQPGTASGYHVITQGYLVGEVVRRVTGETIGTMLREQTAADFHIGLAESEDVRVAELVPPENPPFREGQISEIQLNAARNPPLPPETTATRAWRAAEIPAGNGHGNARSMARVLSILTEPGRASLAARIEREQIAGTDLVLGIPLRWGLGFALGRDFLPGPRTLFWGGSGGAFVAVDLDARAVLAYAMNRMGDGIGDLRGLLLATEAWASLHSSRPGAPGPSSGARPSGRPGRAGNGSVEK
ncbi:serine hydrolase domain-containing protein [Catenuloplanes atrovinosus]|uniref:CubicO group peptidase (Beta-lactamase class C family) n=1 Tax=Catenuloplanes atrovinosus TaxID=137266 RepID=A0AAE3YL22_9ACTN|nr:serine hydrolase domain-containing protein [Catenuloplanes atrovinosus]MDR7274487.1 CubicO group peptidase (beta-lactamase class C family) [Catenuloplanes atrovinosus]